MGDCLAVTYWPREVNSFLLESVVHLLGLSYQALVVSEQRGAVPGLASNDKLDVNLKDGHAVGGLAGEGREGLPFKHRL